MRWLESTTRWRKNKSHLYLQLRPFDDLGLTLQDLRSSRSASKPRPELIRKCLLSLWSPAQQEPAHLWYLHSGNRDRVQDHPLTKRQVWGPTELHGTPPIKGKWRIAAIVSANNSNPAGAICLAGSRLPEATVWDLGFKSCFCFQKTLTELLDQERGKGIATRIPCFPDQCSSL